MYIYIYYLQECTATRSDSQDGFAVFHPPPPKIAHDISDWYVVWFPRNRLFLFRHETKFRRNFVLPRPYLIPFQRNSSKNSAKRNETKFLTHISIHTYLHICACICKKNVCMHIHVHPECPYCMFMLHVFP